MGRFGHPVSRKSLFPTKGTDFTRRVMMREARKTNWVKAALCICMAFVLVASGFTPVQAASKGYSFKYKKVSIKPGDSAEKFLKKAGKPDSADRANSCATEGYDYTYDYGSFILTTCTKNKKKKAKQYVCSIKLVTDKVKTAEGIKIGSTEKQVKKKYKNAKSKYGVYSATKGKTKITIEVTDKKVTAIEITKK